MSFSTAGLTDVGRKREHNEDALLVAPEHGLIVVADGMGGHQAGEVASNIAVTMLAELFERFAEDPEVTWPHPLDHRYDAAANRLLAALQLANAKIHESAHEEGKQGMGTTCVALLVDKAHAWVAWVGDSRGYLWREGALQQVTSDHSLFGELVRSGHLKPADLATFPHKNVITRALGMAATVEIDLVRVDLQDGDILLACSDGLSGMVDDEDIAARLSREVPLDDACRELIDAANSAGGIDNVTVALARYQAS